MQDTLNQLTMSKTVKSLDETNKKHIFPIFASLAEAEAYSEKTGDAYYEICYHLEGNINLSRQAIHGRLYC